MAGEVDVLRILASRVGFALRRAQREFHGAYALQLHTEVQTSSDV